MQTMEIKFGEEVTETDRDTFEFVATTDKGAVRCVLTVERLLQEFGVAGVKPDLNVFNNNSDMIHKLAEVKIRHNEYVVDKDGEKYISLSSQM